MRLDFNELSPLVSRLTTILAPLASEQNQLSITFEPVQPDETGKDPETAMLVCRLGRLRIARMYSTAMLRLAVASAEMQRDWAEEVGAELGAAMNVGGLRNRLLDYPQ